MSKGAKKCKIQGPPKTVADRVRRERWLEQQNALSNTGHALRQVADEAKAAIDRLQGWCMNVLQGELAKLGPDPGEGGEAGKPAPDQVADDPAGDEGATEGQEN